MNAFNKNNQKGFTIVELMIATVVFSMVLLLCITGIVQISRAYYKGVTQSRTQESARQLMDEISTAIQLSGTPIEQQLPTPGNAGPEVTIAAEGSGAICIGGILYTYVIDRQVADNVANADIDDVDTKQINNAMVSQDIGSCPVPLTSGNIAVALNEAGSSGERSMIPENVRITKFSVSRLSSSSGLWSIDISLAYGDQDLIDYFDDSGSTDRVTCKPGTGAEFCSIVELSTIVKRRISDV